MGSRKKRRLREQAERLADPLAPPEIPALDVVAAATSATAEAPASAGPFCGECGSGSLHASPRRGARERWLALGGSLIYRCESCGARFALAPLHGGQRRERAHEVHFEERARLYSRQRRRARLLIMLLAALFTFLTVAWLIHRAEQRRLEIEGIQRVP